MFLALKTEKIKVVDFPGKSGTAIGRAWRWRGQYSNRLTSHVAQTERTCRAIETSLN